MSAPTLFMSAPARLVGVLIALLVALTGLTALAPTSTAATGATITGRFVTEAGVPVDAIRATLLKDNTLFTEVTSGDDGTFELTAVPAGSYSLVGSDWFDNYSTNSGTPVTVADGETKAIGDVELSYFTFVSPNTRLTGYVYDPSGKPARGIQILALPDGPLQPFVGQAGGFGVTDRTGRFNIDTNGQGGLPTPGAYKLYYTDRFLLPEPFSYGVRYSGDQPTWARGTTVTIDSTLHTVAPVTMTRNGGVSGTLTGTVPMTAGTVTVFDADGELVVSKATSAGGAYSINTLRPGTYYLRFSSTDAVPGGLAKFVRTYWPGAATIAGATPVLVKEGRFTSGINQVLSDQLVAFRKPAVSGRAVVGSTLTAAPGSWSLVAATEYTYEWLRGAVVVGTAKTYRPVAADAGKALSVRVTARSLDKSGTATSAPTTTVKHVSTVSGRATYKRPRKQLVLSVRVTVPGLPSPGGTVTVKEGARTVKARVAVRNGTAVVTVLRPKAGRHVYTLSFSGTVTVLPSAGRIVVKVPKSG